MIGATAMAYNYQDILLSQQDRINNEQAQALAELEAGRLDEDSFRVAQASDRILQLDLQRNALAARANSFVAGQQQPQGHPSGLSGERLEVAKSWTSDPNLSEDQKIKIYMDRQKEYARKRATGEYKDVREELSR
jgi:hypothetical protein